jgi:hypothetical protein
MEKAQDQRNLIAQSFPSVLCGLPAIGMDRFGGIIGIQGLCFVGKDARGFLSVALRGGLGNRCPQETIFRRSGRDGDALPFHPTVLFIGHEVRG